MKKTSKFEKLVGTTIPNTVTELNPMGDTIIRIYSENEKNITFEVSGYDGMYLKTYIKK